MCIYNIATSLEAWPPNPGGTLLDSDPERGLPGLPGLITDIISIIYYILVGATSLEAWPPNPGGTLLDIHCIIASDPERGLPGLPGLITSSYTDSGD